VTVSVSVGVSVGANVSVSAMGRNRRGGCTTGVEYEACIDVGMSRCRVERRGCGEVTVLRGCWFEKWAFEPL
jgi:hypothetical protein